jgi:zinc protease
VRYGLKAILLGTALLIATGTPAAHAQVEHHTEIVAPPLRQFTVQQPRRVELANGMVVFLMEDRELPLIRGTAMVRGGAREVPEGKTGLTAIYSEVWRTGGTAGRTGDELDDFLEARGARIETSGDSDSTSISFDIMRNDFNTVFPIFVDLLRNPAFREEKLAIARNQQTTLISRRNDDVTGIATREATRLAWGPGSPYARVPEYATIASITRADLVEWHRRFVHPNNIIFGIVGDFDARQMETQIRRAFNDWRRGTAAEVVNPAPAPAPAGVYFVPRDDVTQTVIRMVHPGVRRDDPDYYALEVMNEILSGGFSGRLLNRIRSDRGLAYTVGGRVGTSYDRPGVVQLGLGTKSTTTVEALQALLAEIEEIQQNPVTSQEIELARSSLLNSFVFLFDTRRKTLSRRLELEFYDYPADFFDRYQAGIRQVSVEDVQRVANRHIRRGDLAILVVGKAEDFDQPLDTLGPVRNIDITIPSPDSAAAPIAPGADPAARALAGRVRDFVGGEQRLAAINSTRSVSAVTVTTPQGQMQLEQETTVVFPDRVRRVMTTPMGEIVMVVSPEAAFMQSPMGAQDLPGSQREAILTELRQDLLYILRNIDHADVAFALGGTESINGVEAQLLDLSVWGSRLQWLVDPATGQILRQVSRSGPAEQVVDYAEWREFDGVRLPARYTVSSGGQQAASAELRSFTVNPEVPAAAFRRE